MKLVDWSRKRRAKVRLQNDESYWRVRSWLRRNFVTYTGYYLGIVLLVVIFLETYLSYAGGHSGIPLSTYAAIWAAVGSGSLAIFAALQGASNAFKRSLDLQPHLMLTPYNASGILVPPGPDREFQITSTRSFELQNLGPGIAALVKGRMGYLSARECDLASLNTIKRDPNFRVSEIFDLAEYLPAGSGRWIPWVYPTDFKSFEIGEQNWKGVGAVVFRVWCQDLDESFGADTVAALWREPGKEEWKIADPHRRVVLGKGLSRS